MKSSFEQMLKEQGVLVYTNTGDSMWPLLHQHKDLLINKPRPEGRLKRLDVPLYKRDNGKYILHRILWVRKNDYVICGDNRFFPEFGIQDRHIFGILDSIVKNGKTIPLRSTPEHPDVPFIYKLYMHLWCDFFIVRAPIVYLCLKTLRFYHKHFK